MQNNNHKKLKAALLIFGVGIMLEGCRRDEIERIFSAGDPKGFSCLTLDGNKTCTNQSAQPISEQPAPELQPAYKL